MYVVPIMAMGTCMSDICYIQFTRHAIKRKTKKHHTVGTLSKSNRKYIFSKQAKSISLTQIPDRSLSEILVG